MTSISPRRFARLVLAAFLASGLAGCAASADPNPVPTTSVAGDVVDGGGAAEVAEPARALIVADERGALTLVDLATEDRTMISGPGGPGVVDVGSDGRFVFVVREQEGRGIVGIVDSGRWTMPHGDHSHYFRGEPRVLGEVEGEGHARLGIGADATVIRFDGEAAVVDHDDLREGAVDPDLSALPGDRPAVVIAGRLIAATDAGVEAPAAIAPCHEAGDAVLTRVGLVFGCADGAVLLSRDIGGSVSVEAIPYPPDAAAPAAVLAGRPDRPDLAGVAGDRGAWLLDVRERSWTLLLTDTPVIAAAAVGDDDARTAVVAADGTVRVLAPDATVLARSEPILAAAVADPALSDRVRLLVDGDHAWVSDPAGGSVIEIDLDDGHTIRTFRDLQPWTVELVG